MSIIKACIFDLGGTIVDRYSLTPKIAFKKTFLNHKIILPNNLLMGMDKIDHMEHMEHIVTDELIKNQWLKNKKKEIGDEEIEILYNDFKEIQKGYTIENMKIIPQTYRCVTELRKRRVKIGVTTGSDKDQMDLVRDILERENIYLDNYVSSTCLGPNSLGIPNPSMIIENMYKLDIDDPKRVIKIDDTKVGIEEGLNAGCWAVGVSRWSSNMNVFTMEEAYKIDNVIHSGTNNYSDNYYQLAKKKITSKSILNHSEAHYVIETLSDLTKIVDEINDMSTPLKKIIK
jgi:phosphonoacetaldehyde hydrolase